MAGLPTRNGGQGKKLARAAGLWASGQLTTSDDDHAAKHCIDEAKVVFGLVEEVDDEYGEVGGADEDTFWLWPDCVEVFAIWRRIQTQWRIGLAGREGLHYDGVLAHLRVVECIKPRRLPEVFSQVQAMERAALHEWAQRSDAADG